jgi:hypothetical protein
MQAVCKFHIWGEDAAREGDVKRNKCYVPRIPYSLCLRLGRRKRSVSAMPRIWLAALS